MDEHWCKDAVASAQNVPPPPPTGSSYQSGYSPSHQQHPAWNSQQSQATAQLYASQWASQQAQVAVQQYTNKLAQSGQQFSEATYQKYFQHYYQYYYQHYYQAYFQQSTTGAAQQTTGNTSTTPLPGTGISTTATAPNPVVTAATAVPSKPLTYAAAVTQGQQSASSAATSLHAAAVAKKPNMSRFTTASSQPDATGTIASTSGKGAAAVTKAQSSFPPALNQFMLRAFDTCKSDADREAMKVELRKLVDRVSADGRLLKHDWAKEQVPKIPTSTVTSGAISSANSVLLSKHTVDKKVDTHSSASASRAADDDMQEKKRKKTRWADAEQDEGQAAAVVAASTKASPAVTLHKDNLKQTSSNKSNASSTITPLQVWNEKMDLKKAAGISPLAVSSDELKMREKRANRFLASENDSAAAATPSSSSAYNHTTASNGSNKYQNTTAMSASAAKKDKKAKKRGRGMEFSGGNDSAYIGSGSTSTVVGGGMTDAEMESLRIVGTCRRLEKDYFRLTSAPDPSTVRPEEILRKTIELLKSKWAEEGSSAVDYVYMCNQLKSMRQDLTVQHIQNDLTVAVYEFHAHCALESEDLNEYNQCQTQLKQLYEKGLAPLTSVYEFTAYRILYYVCVQGSTKRQSSSADISGLLVSLSDEAKSHPFIKHALALRSASQQQNYHRMFKLYADTPNHGALIIDMVLGVWRGKALQRIVKAYKPEVSLSFLCSELAFDSEDEARAFVKRSGGVFTDKQETDLDTKTSVIDLTKVVEKDKLLL